MKVGFIKNFEQLQENERKKSFGLNTQVSNFSKLLDTFPDGNILMGYIGKFGTGKSSLLEAVKESRKEKNKKEKWWQFDAWKYPERKNLWENFLIDFVEENTILGFWEKWWVKLKIFDKQRYLLIFLIMLALTVLSINISIIESYLWKILLLLLLPLISTLGIISNFPIIHLSEFQKELRHYLKNKKIFIIVEDIDRSDDAGIYFLETLSYFLSKLNKELESKSGKTKIVVIAPIDTNKFKEKKDFYGKCFDYTEFKQLIPNMKKFVNEVFDERFFEKKPNSKYQIIKFLGDLLRLPDGDIRKINMILRNATNRYGKIEKSGKEIDFRLIIAFEAARHFKLNLSDQALKNLISKYGNKYKNTKVTFFDIFEDRGKTEEGNIPRSFISIWSNLFIRIISDQKKLTSAAEANINAIVFKETDIELPYINENSRNQIIISDRYLKY